MYFDFYFGPSDISEDERLMTTGYRFKNSESTTQQLLKIEAKTFPHS